MNSKRLYALLATTLVFVIVSFGQEMTKDSWQQEVTRYTQLRTEEQAKLQQLTNDVNALQAQSTKADADANKCLDELYALVGSDAQKAAAFRGEIDAAETKANELAGLSDVDLMARKSEVIAFAATVKGLRDNKLSLIPEFSERLDALDQKVASLVNTVSVVTSGNTYTVGEGDCLWRIAKKSDIYDNAWSWPKIWKANKIKNPDLIFPGRTLTIPPAGDMSSGEKSAAKKYYNAKKEGAQ